MLPIDKNIIETMHVVNFPEIDIDTAKIIKSLGFDKLIYKFYVDDGCKFTTTDKKTAEECLIKDNYYPYITEGELKIWFNEKFGFQYDVAENMVFFINQTERFSSFLIENGQKKLLYRGDNEVELYIKTNRYIIDKIFELRDKEVKDVKEEVKPETECPATLLNVDVEEEPVSINTDVYVICDSSRYGDAVDLLMSFGGHLNNEHQYKYMENEEICLYITSSKKINSFKMDSYEYKLIFEFIEKYYLKLELPEHNEKYIIMLNDNSIVDKIFNSTGEAHEYIRNNYPMAYCLLKQPLVKKITISD